MELCTSSRAKRQVPGTPQPSSAHCTSDASIQSLSQKVMIQTIAQPLKLLNDSICHCTHIFCSVKDCRNAIKVTSGATLKHLSKCVSTVPVWSRLCTAHQHFACKTCSASIGCMVTEARKATWHYSSKIQHTNQHHATCRVQHQ